MEGYFSTKLTKNGQTTIPREIRNVLEIEDGARVYWQCDGKRAYLTTEPVIPLSVSSAEDFWNRVAEAEADISAGKTHDAHALSEQLRTGHATKAV